jgi:hypothetical protein
MWLQVGSTGVTMRSQKEITLKNDLDARDRLDIYRNFLLYCMSGDVVALPMGSTGESYKSCLTSLGRDSQLFHHCHYCSCAIKLPLAADCICMKPRSPQESPQSSITLYCNCNVAAEQSNGSFLAGSACGFRHLSHTGSPVLPAVCFTEHAMLPQWWWSGTPASLRGFRSWATSWACRPSRSTPCTPASQSRPTAARCSRCA